MKNKILALFALVAIALGGYGLFFPKVKDTIAVAPTLEKEKLISIWIAKQTLLKGEKIYHDDLKIRYVPVSEAMENGILDSIELNFVDGMVANNTLLSNEWVMPSDITKPGQDGYVDLIIQPNRVPYPIEVEPEVVVGGIINNGTKVDVLALASINQNLANDSSVASAYGLNLTPLLMSVTVLQVNSVLFGEEEQQTRVNLILELTQSQVAKLTIAKRVAKIEVHKSLLNGDKQSLIADSGDVLPEFNAVKEYRPNQSSIDR